MVKSGSIYVYVDPKTGRAMYVGSTRDGNTMRRHAVHLREKGSIGPWLRAFANPPTPCEIEKVEYAVAEELLQRETQLQGELCTLRSQGGLNKILAWPAPDHSVIGKLGGGIRQMSVEARKSMLSGIGITEHAQKRHQMGAKKGGDSVRGIPRIYSEASRKSLSAAGRKGGIRSNHTRWHVRQNITSKDCSLCEERT